jgi:FAD/FMN-containing dehydrogenase
MKPGAMPVPEFRAATKAVDRDLFELIRKHRGSISAEHGIGLLKKEFLSFTRTPLEIEYFRQMKRIFDPKGILNPGKIWD